MGVSLSDPLEHLRLAGVTRLSLGGRGPKDAFLFDPHRLALPCWALALGEARGALLVTLDRHFDLVPPPKPAPDASAGLRRLDEYARWELGPRNDDHLLAAMDAGLIGDVIAIARANPRGALADDRYLDRAGRTHRILRFASVDRLCQELAARSDPGRDTAALLAGSGPALLDVDLDCFTTLSDADPTSVVPWPQALIREFLLPEGSEALWNPLLARCHALTLAREAFHCGGVLAGDRLFAELAPVLFRELLWTDLP